MPQKAKNQKQIYNFEFPSFCKQIKIDSYIFKRVPEYKERIKSLQHGVSITHEFRIPLSTGSHAITSIVDLPSKEKKAVFPWGNEKPTALDDILLLLSIFTSRHVFAAEPDENGNSIIVADPRQYYFGRSLRTSLPYKRNESVDGSEYNAGVNVKFLKHPLFFVGVFGNICFTFTINNGYLMRQLGNCHQKKRCHL
jgi:hypothetical protein